MDWRTSDEYSSKQPAADGRLAQGDAGAVSLAHVADADLSQRGHGRFLLDETFVRELQTARAANHRFGGFEDVTTGEQFVFGNAEEKLACLARDPHTQTE